LRVVRDVDPHTGKMISRKWVLGPEEEVQAVRFIFDAVANRGWSLRRICRELEARGVKPSAIGRGCNKTEGRWNPTSVQVILGNRKYVGDLPYNRTHVGKYWSWKGGEEGQALAVDGRGTRKGRRSPNPTADVIIVPDIIPPIIDRETFARANTVLQMARGRTSPGGKCHHYLLTHMLVCGDCGSYLRGQPDPHRKQKTYICAKYKECRACHRNNVAEAQVWAAVLGVLKGEILNPARLDAVEAEIERQLQAERASGEPDRLRRQIAALDRDIDRGNARLATLPDDRVAGVVAKLRQWEGERAGLVERLQELEDNADRSKAILAEARKQLWRLREALEGDDLEAQATVAREVVGKVEIRFAHEHSHGRRSPTGTRRLLSRATAAVIYVRPGLGVSDLSRLFSTGSSGPAHASGRGRASSCPRGCAAPG
jgi:hypothetical protein